jgi:hypothetical protein
MSLFVGTANPFGPEVTLRDFDIRLRREVWEYHPNERGDAMAET